MREPKGAPKTSKKVPCSAKFEGKWILQQSYWIVDLLHWNKEADMAEFCEQAAIAQPEQAAQYSEFAELYQKK